MQTKKNFTLISLTKVRKLIDYNKLNVSKVGHIHREKKVGEMRGNDFYIVVCYRFSFQHVIFNKIKHKLSKHNI